MGYAAIWEYLLYRTMPLFSRGWLICAILIARLLYSTAGHGGNPSRVNFYNQTSLHTINENDQHLQIQAENRPAPAWEIVIARHSESLHWINKIPDSWQVTIMNKVFIRLANGNTNCLAEIQGLKLPIKAITIISMLPL